MPLSLPPVIVIFDTEYTTWEGARERNWSGEGEYREVVQIAAIRFAAREGTELGSFDVFVKPLRNPVLSDYFTALTGITNRAVAESGIGFAEALDRFKRWAGNDDLYCFGTDGAILKENCGLLGLRFPFDGGRFRDVREVFRAGGVLTDDYQSGTISRAFGIEPPARGHNALNDVRTIAVALRALASRAE